MPDLLPPWKHRFRTLTIFCEVVEASLRPRAPAALECATNIVQITTIHFDSTVPTLPYCDSKVIVYRAREFAASGCAGGTVSR